MPIVKPAIFGGTFVSMEVHQDEMLPIHLTVNPERIYLLSVVLVINNEFR